MLTFAHGVCLQNLGRKKVGLAPTAQRPQQGRASRTAVCEKVEIKFEPAGIRVEAQAHESLLEVALVHSQADEKLDYCKDGGCFKCEMEVDGELLRACQYRLPSRGVIEVIR